MHDVYNIDGIQYVEKKEESSKRDISVILSMSISSYLINVTISSKKTGDETIVIK
jgi:hypothetical protein